MRKNFSKILAIGLLLILTGCIETREDYIINPDGSGKVVYEALMPLKDWLVDEDADPVEKAREEVGKILKGSRGVEAWKEVTFKVTDDLKLLFKGTAYFHRLSVLRIGGSVKSNCCQGEFIKLPDGSMELRLVEEKELKPENSKPTKELSDEESARIAKAKFKQIRPMLDMVLKGLRIEKIFHLPGTLDKVTIFKRGAASNTVQIIYEGEKILKAIDDLTSNDTWWKEHAAVDQNICNGPSDEELNEKLFGSKGLPRATVTGELRPLFEYVAEVAAAKKAYVAMREKLGLPKEPEVLPAAKDGKFKSLRVGGIRMIYESNLDTGVRPFNYDKGYTLSLIGELSGTVVRFKEGRVLSAVADNGDDLLPKGQRDREILFPTLSKDKSTVVFDVILLVPKSHIKGLGEVSGEFIYEVAHATKTVDLGILKLKSGSKGRELGAFIASIEESKWVKGSYELKLKVKTYKQYIKEIQFFDEDGKRLEVEGPGHTQADGTLILKFRYKTKFPPKAHIVIEMYDKLQEYTISFKLNNISLMGVPMKLTNTDHKCPDGRRKRISHLGGNESKL